MVKKLVEDLDALGYGYMKVAIRSDQEPAIVDVKNELRRKRWQEFESVMEEGGDPEGTHRIFERILVQ